MGTTDTNAFSTYFPGRLLTSKFRFPILSILVVLLLLATWKNSGSQVCSLSPDFSPLVANVEKNYKAVHGDRHHENENQNQAKQKGRLPGQQQTSDGFEAPEAVTIPQHVPEAASPPKSQPSSILKPEPSSPQNTAVIMETDPSRVANLVPVMLHFASVLGPQWPIVLLTLEEKWNANPISSPGFKRLVDSKQIRITYIPNSTVITDHHSISMFLASPWLWEQFQSSQRVLLFQADSILCSKSTHNMEDFLEWDLIGAPIAPQYGQGYNGGLSLRNPKLMLEITNDLKLRAAESEVGFEDQWFYGKAKERGAHLPDAETAQAFAVETVYYEKPLGYHQPFRWQQDNMKQITEWCPEIGMLAGGSHFF